MRQIRWAKRHVGQTVTVCLVRPPRGCDPYVRGVIQNVNRSIVTVAFWLPGRIESYTARYTQAEARAALSAPQS